MRMAATKVMSGDLALPLVKILLHFFRITTPTWQKKMQQNLSTIEQCEKFDLQRTLHTWILSASVEAKTKSKQNVATRRLSRYVTSGLASQNQLLRR